MIDERIAKQLVILNMKINADKGSCINISGIYDSYMSRMTSVNFNPSCQYMSPAVDALLLELHLFRVEKHGYMIKLSHAS